MNQALVTYEDLQEMFNTRTVSELASVLEQNNVHYLKDRKKRPTTTQNSLDHAMGLPISGISSSVADTPEEVEAL